MVSFRVFILGVFIALNALYAGYLTLPSKVLNSNVDTYLSFKAALSAYELEALKDKESKALRSKNEESKASKDKSEKSK